MKKRGIAGISVLAAVIACLAACGSPEKNDVSSAETENAEAKEGEKLLIGISQPTMTHPIRTAEQVEIDKWQEAHPDVEIVVTDGRLDSQKQISDIEDLISKDVDILLVAANQPSTLTAVLDKAQKAEVPVIAYDRKLTKPEQAMGFIGPDDVEVGRKGCQILVDELGTSGNIVIIEGTSGSANATDRQTGFMEELQKYPDIKVVSDQVANFQRVQAVTIMENVLQANPDIDAVYCHNDEMALGAMQVLQAAGRNDVIIVGSDGQKDALKAIIDGGLAGTVKKEMEFPKILDMAYSYLTEGTEIEEYTYLDSPEITKENVEEYYDPDSIF